MHIARRPVQDSNSREQIAGKFSGKFSGKMVISEHPGKNINKINFLTMTHDAKFAFRIYIKSVQQTYKCSELKTSYKTL